MKTIETQLERKLQIWTLIGPLCLIFTLAFSFFKPSSNPMYLPYAALFGMTICWRWQMRGLAITVALLFAMTTYRMFGLSADERLWEAGMMTAIALGCLVTALSFDEAKSLMQEEWEQPVKEIEELQNELKNLQDKLEEASCQLAKETDERLASFNERERLEIHCKEFESRYLKLQAELQKNQLDVALQADEKVMALQNEVKTLQEKLSKAMKERQVLYNDKEQFEAQHKELGNQYLKIQSDLQKAQKNQLEEALQAQEELKKLQDQFARQLEEAKKPAEPVKLDHWQEYRQAEGMYLQLRIQFEEKGKALDTARKELFHAQEELERLRREHEEKHIFERSSHEEEMEAYLEKVEEKYAKTVKNLQDEIDLLQEIITHQISEI